MRSAKIVETGLGMGSGGQKDVKWDGNEIKAPLAGVPRTSLAGATLAIQ